MILQDRAALERYLSENVLPDIAIVASAVYADDALRLLAHLNGYEVAWIFAQNANFYSASYHINCSAVLHWNQNNVSIKPPPVAIHRVRVCDALAMSTIPLGQPLDALTPDELIIAGQLPSGWDSETLYAYWWQDYKLPEIGRQLKRLSPGCGIYPHCFAKEWVIIHPTEARPLYHGEYLALIAGQYGDWLQHVIKHYTGEKPPEAYQVGSEWVYDFSQIEPQNYRNENPISYIPFQVKP